VGIEQNQVSLKLTSTLYTLVNIEQRIPKTCSRTDGYNVNLENYSLDLWSHGSIAVWFYCLIGRSGVINRHIWFGSQPEFTPAEAGAGMTSRFFWGVKY